MGCRQSKDKSAVLVDEEDQLRKDKAKKSEGATQQQQTQSNTTSPVSTTSSHATLLHSNFTDSRRNNTEDEPTLPPSITRLAEPGKRLCDLLREVRENADPLIWTEAKSICESYPEAASYRDPITMDTSLHLACRAIDVAFDPSNRLANVVVDECTTSVDVVRAIIQACPDSVSRQNNSHLIPLHYALSPELDEASPTLTHRTEIISLLVAADYELSIDYLSRTDIFFDEEEEGCSALYHAVSKIPDDFLNPPGPTLAFIRAIHHSSRPTMVCAKNKSNHDKPLSLLYRRFSRQFDLSEKFFPGDNSRNEVLVYRSKYKTAAMNTWKIIQLLLRPITDNNSLLGEEDEEESCFRMVHAAVQVDCPPDLLRYIIETKPEEVREVDERGRLPLHLAAIATPNKNDEFGKFAIDSKWSMYHSKFVMDELLYSYPDGAAVFDLDGKLPLELAIESGKNWIDGGIKSLYDVYPDAMKQIDVTSYPSISDALSFSTQYAEEHDEGGGRIPDGLDHVVKEEAYDAIMMVQKEDADLGDIISAMWANEVDGGVQMLACMAITRIVEARLVVGGEGEDGTKVLGVALTAVTAVVNAMKNHPNEPAVQEKACGALLAMACADTMREVSFAASGAVASIVAAMQAHVSDEIVQEVACGALRAIVQSGGSERATVVASVSGYTAIQNALGAHPNQMGVQREACKTLEILTAFPDANLPELPDAQTAPLLNAAAERFPKECKDVADIVLTRLAK